MPFSERVRIAAGTVIGIAGLLILARVDFPNIVHGGWAALFSATELLVAAVMLSAALGLATSVGYDDR